MNFFDMLISMLDIYSGQEGDVPEMQQEIWMKVYNSRKSVLEHQPKIHYSLPSVQNGINLNLAFDPQPTYMCRNVFE